MANATNRDQFKDLVMRKCGFPVIELEIDDEQIEDAIDESIKYYHDYHFDGSERVYYKHQITSTDITNGYITLPDDIHFIFKVMEVGTSQINNNIFGARYQFALNEFFNITSGPLSYYTETMRYINLITEMFSTRPGTNYSRISNRLVVHMDWSANVTQDRYLVIECTRIFDPSIYPKIWADRWLINYATILVRRQIGIHLMKYNVTLPGNVTYNGESIYSIAQQEKEKMEEEMINSYSTPPMDVIA
jgi:hypothetical protein